jgi:hypothetical protein
MPCDPRRPPAFDPARATVANFVTTTIDVRLHIAIGYVTPTGTGKLEAARQTRRERRAAAREHLR